jgi:hypothetical protein
MNVDNGVQANANLHQRAQGEHPEREVVTAIGILDALGTG